MVRANAVGVGAVLLGAALLLAGADTAQARQGEKWWNPGIGNGRRVERPAPRAFSRQWRTWGDRRIYRDMIVIRSTRFPRYRAWRTYFPPEYIYSRRIIRVRPVRFFVSAVIGGVSVRGSYHDDYLYGCNFCGARFGSYGAYRAHVMSCPDRPRGYRVECGDWDGPGPYDDQGWRDSGPDGGYGQYRVYDRDRDHDRDDRAYDRDDRTYDRDDRAYDRDDRARDHDDRAWDRDDDSSRPYDDQGNDNDDQ